ncbi:MAG: hypothetical protein KKC80_05725 [Candidatus Margulisbacteria bacterium]|nr:hypothetical protein [Candidatus Margulisiibacteriota bacterium]MBU1617626.1 hypothetical protein [Candidatus Margulisiibacteriota bacterium]
MFHKKDASNFIAKTKSLKLTSMNGEKQLKEGKMQTYKIENTQEISVYLPKKTNKKCLFYDGEICSAPQIKYRACLSCSRFDPRSVVLAMFDKIKEMAEKFFSFSGRSVPPPT